MYCSRTALCFKATAGVAVASRSSRARVDVDNGKWTLLDSNKSADTNASIKSRPVLKSLDALAPDSHITFQTFADGKERRAGLTKVLHGLFMEHTKDLERLNQDCVEAGLATLRAHRCAVCVYFPGEAADGNSK